MDGSSNLSAKCHLEKSIDFNPDASKIASMYLTLDLLLAKYALEVVLSSFVGTIAAS